MAGIFGAMFRMLAEDPNDDHKALARKLLRMSKTYDFDIYQMDCDVALVALEIAHKQL